MKRKVIVIPSLLMGLAIGGLGVTAFAASNSSSTSTVSSTQSSTHAWGYGGMMDGSVHGYVGWQGSPHAGGWGGMMGQTSGTDGSGDWSNVMGGMINTYYGNGPTLSDAKANSEEVASLRHASVDKLSNTVTYSGQSAKVVILGGAMGSTRSNAGEHFVIDGLMDPTIHVDQGATVTLELINEDTDMPHGIEVTSASPPFSFMSMMQGGIYPDTFIHPIPAASKNLYPVATTTFKASQSGTFHYICQYPGHAAEGMYGTIIVG